MARLLRPLRGRDYALLFGATTISLVGDGVFLMALAWQVFRLSNVPTAMSAVGLAMSIPHLVLLLPGGVVSDRWDRRRVMIVADTARALIVTVLGVVTLSGHLRLWHVLALMAAYGAATAFFGPAFDALVPDVAPPDLLPQANALDQLLRPLALRLVGPMLGGWMTALLGTGPVFVFDAATFAAAIGLLVFVRTRGRQPAGPGLAPVGVGGPGSVVAEMAEGFRYVRSEVWLWGTFLAASLGYLLFLGPSEVLLPFIVKNDIGRSAGALSMVLGAGGVGALGAALLVGSRRLPRRHMAYVYAAWSFATLAVAGYGVAHHVWQLMACSAVFHAFETAGLIVWTTTKQRLVPTRLLGRVCSFEWFIAVGLVPASFALTGPVAARFGARPTLVVAGIAGAVVTMAFLFLPGMLAARSSDDEAVVIPAPVLAAAA
ncbi:MAG: MFS transporter [Acidimicrobiales bacterium]